MNHNNQEEDEEIFLDMIDKPDNGNSTERSKIKTLEEEDLISNLPEAVIVRILSFLPTIEERIRTGILAKRWKYLWTISPVLDFSNYTNRPISDFISFIDKTLYQRGSSKVKRLRVNFEYWGNYSGLASRLNCWIRYAAECNAEELDFTFNAPDLSFELPEVVFYSSYLTSLALANCILVPNVKVSWKSLKILTIWNSKLSNELIQKMISASPVLEILELSFCYGFNRLDIDSPSVKKFVLGGYFEPYKAEDDAVLEISAPHILSLDIGGDLSLKKLQLVNMPSLTEASIDFSRYTEHLDIIDEDADENMLKDLLQSLHHVNDLAIGGWWMEVISLLELKGWHSPLSKRKCLRFGKFITRNDFPGLSNLLHSSPDLETLLINTGPHIYVDPGGSYTGENYLSSKSRSFQCLQRHLKTIKIAYYIEWDRESELVQFLLDNACVLEKMVITCGSKAANGSCSEAERLLHFTFKLLSFPRASRNAVVLCPDFMPKIR